MGTPQLSSIEWFVLKFGIGRIILLYSAITFLTDLLLYRLNLWVKAYAHSQTYDYPTAIVAFRQLLEETSPLRNNSLIMVALGEIYYYSGDVTNAKIILQQVIKMYFLNNNLILV